MMSTEKKYVSGYYYTKLLLGSMSQLLLIKDAEDDEDNPTSLASAPLWSLLTNGPRLQSSTSALLESGTYSLIILVQEKIG